MKSRLLFMLITTAAVLLQGYFFSGLLSAALAPSLVTIALYAASARFSLRFVLILGAWTGMLMGAVSLHAFGLYVLAGMLTASLIYWLRSKQFTAGSFVSTTLILSLAVFFHSTLIMVVVRFPSMHVGLFQSFVSSIGVVVTTLIFAWFIDKLVQLEV